MTLDMFTLYTAEECLKEAAPLIINYAFIYVAAFIFYVIGEALEKAEVDPNHKAAENFNKLRRFAPTCNFIFKFLTLAATIICAAVYKGWI